MDAKLFDSSHNIRSSVLSGISVSLSVISVFLAVFCIFYVHAYLMASLEILFSLYAFYIHHRAKKRHHTQMDVHCFTYLLLLLFIVSNLFLPPENHGFIWTLVCPLLMYSLVGLKRGFISSLLLFITQISIVYYRTVDLAAFNTINLMVNLVSSYLVIWLISHTYEFHRHEVESTLSNLASRDALTSAHNRLALTTAFEYFQTHRDKEELSFLIVDIDFFKAVNDQYGHDIGDKVLIETSQLMMQIVGDDNLYRIGGEEFCITLFNRSLDEAHLIGERIRKLIAANPFIYDDHHIHLTLSVGICEYKEGNRIEDLLRMADHELYRAKKSGRNQVRLCPTAEQSVDDNEQKVPVTATSHL
ncbi:GGDEF domain-containing protein [Vibrio nitrifigilis]|uniref:GGDEF domain-containing protein n=1 Tax=Vibrio nitrifigilis TaxID=2789781 RepID=UPI002E343783|nr:GGDEF domain-containing protein [Vibrio nitrifigilis]